MVVYSATNSMSPKSYKWAVESDSADLAFSCTEGNYASSEQFFVQVGGCTANDFPVLADEAHLSGAFGCNGTAVNWDFTKQVK